MEEKAALREKQKVKNQPSGCQGGAAAKEWFSLRRAAPVSTVTPGGQRPLWDLTTWDQRWVMM